MSQDSSASKTKRALVSVYDKAGVEDFCSSLTELGWEVVSTGGTHARLAAAGVQPLIAVSDVTGFPEILGGRVKSLHPAIHGGLLADRGQEAHLEELQGHGIGLIDMVVCNLYPFEDTIAKEGVTIEEAVENIDIGGVAMIRAAAKNFASVFTITSSADYADVLTTLRSGQQQQQQQLRRRLAASAFQLTAAYDVLIAQWLLHQCNKGADTTATTAEAAAASSGDAAAAGEAVGTIIPSHITLAAKQCQSLRYGENPHQCGALFQWCGGAPAFEQIGGLKELSYNNILDIQTAWSIPQEFTEPTVAIIKHCTPCGVASAATLPEAFEAARLSDPVSAFGSIIAVNGPIDLSFVEAVGKLFVEVLLAKSYTPEALEWLAQRKKNCRVLRVNDTYAVGNELDIRSVFGGVLVQSRDTTRVQRASWRVVSKAQPTAEQMDTMAFAWQMIKWVKSNAIVLAQGTRTVGIGHGEPNRVDAVGHAVTRAGDEAHGSILASDAFFPFPDGIERAAEGGVVAVIQPGGSIRDDQVIEAVDRLGLVMVVTGERHFRH